MKEIRRYPIPDVGKAVIIDIPLHAEFAKFGFQARRREFSVWYVVDPSDTNTKNRTFMVVGTGETVPDGYEHRESIIMDDNFTIFHLFELVVK